MKKETPKKSVWGKPVISTINTTSINQELFPALPQKSKPITINGKAVIINKKPSVVHRQAITSPSPTAFTSDSGSTSPMEEKPSLNHFYTPPLPNTKSQPTSTWGQKRKDNFDLAVEKALKEKEEREKNGKGKGKGKGSRGVKLNFF